MDYTLFITQDTKASEAIDMNPLMLLMFEYLNIPLGFQDKTIAQVADDGGHDLSVILSIANLYNGIQPLPNVLDNIKDPKLVIKFLDNSHHHYLNEKFPLLTSYINEISKINSQPEIGLLIKFFDEYLDEVSDHLKYENSVVFPYVFSLIDKRDTELNHEQTYSMSEYRSHHDDIEEKLIDLKNLLVRYLPDQNDSQVRRRLLLALNELESDLHIHSLVEETILIPIVERFEQSINA